METLESMNGMQRGKEKTKKGKNIIRWKNLETEYRAQKKKKKREGEREGISRM